MTNEEFTDCVETLEYVPEVENLQPVQRFPIGSTNDEMQDFYKNLETLKSFNFDRSDLKLIPENKIIDISKEVEKLEQKIRPLFALLDAETLNMLPDNLNLNSIESRLQALKATNC